MTEFDVSRGAFVDAVEGADGPVVVRLAAPLPDCTPLAAYGALVRDADHGFLLESAEKTPGSDPDGAFRPGTDGGKHARYSFVGYDPEAVVTVTGDDATVTDLGGGSAVEARSGTDVLDTLRGALPDATLANFDAGDRQRLDGGLVGFLAYDAVYDLWLDEVGVERPEPVCPDAEFVLATRVVAFDHAADTAELVCTPVVAPDDDPGATYDALVTAAADAAERLRGAETPSSGGFVREGERAGSREAYEAAVGRAKEHVLDGDVYQGVISRSRVLDGEMDPLGLYAALRDVNPSPYMYLLRHGDRSVVGASPETLFSVRGDRVTVNPIAGTCPRGTGPVDDRRLAGEMLADGKERAEHTMLVDLGRNDVRRVSEAGSVRVDEFMSVIKYSHVQHIESTVTGRLAPEHDAFDAARATFPAGTLTGAPKVRAMEIVDALEETARGVYGGGVGYFSWDGDADFAIVIRSATVDHTADETTVRAGAGVVADSVPASEYDETEAKMRGVLDAVERIERRPEEAR